MKGVRLFLFGFSAVVGLLLLGVMAVFSSTVQTLWARQALASRFGDQASLGSVDAGLRSVVVKELRIEQAGRVLILPSLEAELPLWPALTGKGLRVTRLSAFGWTLDLAPSRAPEEIPPTPAPTVAVPPDANAPQVEPGQVMPAVLREFAGIFDRLELPTDVALDGVNLDGDILLPGGKGRARLSLRGGGFMSGSEGTLTLKGAFALRDPKVSTIAFSGVVSASMDTPRTFTRLSAQLDASASGTQFPDGVKLTAKGAAARGSAGETYSASVVSEGRAILGVTAEFPGGAPRLEGRWTLDVRDTDVAPFAFGHPLPGFAAAGTGVFNADAALAAVQVSGRLDVGADRLEVLRPEFAELGSIEVTADFAVLQSENTLTVQRLEAALKATRPVLEVRTMQTFSVNSTTGELRASDPASALLGVSLHGLPFAWAKPLWPGVEITAGSIRGEMVVQARDGGLAVRSTTPVALDGITYGPPDAPLLQQVDLTLAASVDFTPLGWQAEIADLAVKSYGATWLGVAARVGRLAGAGQPLKTTGRMTLDFPALLAQPVASDLRPLTAGSATVGFSASLDGRREVQVELALTGLTTGRGESAMNLPSLVVDVRADLAPDGRSTFDVPIRMESAGRQSDLSLTGTVTPGRANTHAVEAQLVSTRLVVEDAMVFAALVPDGAKPAEASDSTPQRSPPWAALHGSVDLQLAKVIYADAFEMNHVGGTLRIARGALELADLRAGFGHDGEARLDGRITFDALAPQPYGLTADLAVRDFNPGPLFQAMHRDRPATLEGRFDIRSTLAGRAASLGELTLATAGEMRVLSKEGVFRGLPLQVDGLLENTGRVAGWIASAGTALSSMTGRREPGDVASKAQAMAEVAQGLYPISYDQLSVVLFRDAARNTRLEDFSLISPEIRLSGSGQAVHRAGSSLLDDPLTMEFTLRARGRQGELLKFIGALEPVPDELGYAAFTVPLTVGGTLGRPDTTELNSRLVALALEKSGVTDRAAELLNRLRGGGK